MRRAVSGLAMMTLAFFSFSSTSLAQAAQEAQAFMNEMIEITNDINQDTAKEAYKKCLAMGDKLKAMQGLVDEQRLYFESEVERCQAYAMNNGNFSDATGDQCSHHIAYTKKLVAVIEATLKKPGTEGEFMMNFAQQLESAMRMGPSLGCKFDYDGLSKTVEAATAHGQKQPKEPDFAFMEEIAAVTQAITPETAKDDVAKCSALTDKMAQKAELFPFEKYYYPALIEGCMAAAKEKGAPADVNGDTCDHMFRRSEQTVNALNEGKREPSPFDPFLDVLREDLKATAAHAKELKCKQDFSVLKEQ